MTFVLKKIYIRTCWPLITTELGDITLKPPPLLKKSGYTPHKPTAEYFHAILNNFKLLLLQSTEILNPQLYITSVNIIL